MQHLLDNQHHEFEQQQLIEGIVQSLHRATRDEDTYHVIFGDVAIILIHLMRGDRNVSTATVLNFDELVLAPIRHFTNVDAELRYLYARLHEKVAASAIQVAYRQYNEYMLLRRC